MNKSNKIRCFNNSLVLLIKILVKLNRTIITNYTEMAHQHLNSLRKRARPLKIFQRPNKQPAKIKIQIIHIPQIMVSISICLILTQAAFSNMKKVIHLLPILILVKYLRMARLIIMELIQMNRKMTCWTRCLKNSKRRKLNKLKYLIITMLHCFRLLSKQLCQLVNIHLISLLLIRNSKTTW